MHTSNSLAGLVNDTETQVHETALEKNAGSGSALNQCRSETLLETERCGMLLLVVLTPVLSSLDIIVNGAHPCVVLSGYYC